MMSDSVLNQMCETVRAAAAARTPLRIRAGGTKDFYGNPTQGELFDPRAVTGIVDYEPTELVITARAGTPLTELEQLLADNGQMLAFEPPHFGPTATVGGCVAAGLSGPRRVSFGSTYGGVRDFVLGARLIDGHGELLSFGGTVMKNVAGYDVARLLTGSMGILGVIVDVSLKVLPRPITHHTLTFEMSAETAVDKLNEWAGQPLPLSASVWHEGMLYLRLAGAVAAVSAAKRQLGGDDFENSRADAFWHSIREQTHVFFTGDLPVWRVAVPSTAAALPVRCPQLIEWGGALRWLRTEQTAAQMREIATKAGGHATLLRGGDRSDGVLTPLAPTLATIHRRLKARFDPAGIFNPGRLYPDL